MKFLNHYSCLAAACIALAACTNEDLQPVQENPAAENSFVQKITVTLPSELPAIGDASTRNVISVVDNSLKTSWADGDTLGIFPSQGGQVEFPIEVTSGDGKSATFDGGGWALKASYTYASYYPFDRWNVFRDSKSIPMDYTGQVQIGNDNSSHLGEYDYLASGSVTPLDGSVNIKVDRQSTILIFQLAVPADDTYTELELRTDGTPFVTKATLDISGSSPVTTPTEYSRIVRLKLQDVTLKEGDVLTAYMMAYPVGSVTPKVVLYGENGYYQATLANKDLNKGGAKLWNTELTDAKLTNLNLIASAEEKNEGVSFNKQTNGTVNLNDATNRAMLEKVTYIKVTGCEDPTVCDEIGYFHNLQELRCSENQLISLDVSRNLALKLLACTSNSLTYLDLTKNTALESLYLTNNPFISLDVSRNFNLRTLYIRNVKLTTIDLSGNPALEFFDCCDSDITYLDLSHNILLNNFWCIHCLLSEFDITACKSLYKHSVFCGGQYSDASRTTNKTLTLYARAEDTSNISSSTNVVVINK